MNKMQRRFAQAAKSLMSCNEDVVLLFGGAGIVDQSNFTEFKENSYLRVIDCGIAEQAIIGLASGLAIEGKYQFSILNLHF